MVNKMEGDNKEQNSVIGCIVVRLKSTRLPRKALADIKEKPLLLRLIERLQASKLLSRIVICTSTNPQDTELMEYAETWGIDAFAGSEDDVVDRLKQTVKEFNGNHLVRITGDNILTDPVILDQLIEAHIEKRADYTRMNDLPLGISPEILSANILPELERLIPEPSHSEYMGLYAFDPARFKCEVVPTPEHFKRPHYRLTVDTPEDLALIQEIYENLTLYDYGPELADVINYLDNHPSYIPVSYDSPIRLPDDKTMTYREYLAMLSEKADLAKRETV